jgi:hypothetical protein
MDITSSVTCNGEQDDQYFMFSFEFSTGDFITVVVIEEPYLVSRTKWVEFIQTIKDRGTMRLNFYQGNGYGTLSTSNGKVKFGAMPSGYGGDMSVNFELSAKYSDTMVQYLSEMIAHPNTKCMTWEGLRV